MPSSIHELRTLVSSYHPLIVVETVEEERLSELVAEVCDQLDLPLFDWSLARGLCKYPNKRSIMGQTAQPISALKHAENLAPRAVFLFKDLSPHLGDAAVARVLRETVGGIGDDGSSLILCGSSVAVPTELENLAVYFRLQLPEADELGAVLEDTVAALREKHSFNDEADTATRGQLVAAMAGMTLNQARQSIARAVLEDRRLCLDDLARIRNHKAEMIRDGGLLEYFPPGANAFQIGGFNGLKRWLARAATGFSAQAAAWNIDPPRGILIVGVQGCGKSLAAKAIAKGWGVPLLKLDAGVLYNKYIGETEKNFREAAELAESVAPCVLWIDEMEKGFASGGSDDNDGGTSKRMLASFLTWLQEKSPGVFVVGTANDIFAMPPELMRKGRFDEIFFVDLPDPAERTEIFRIHLGLRNQAEQSFDLAQLVAASEGFSGSEIEQALIASLYRALHEGTAPGTALLLRELSDTVPLSVTRREDLQRLRSEARDRFVPAR